VFYLARAQKICVLLCSAFVPVLLSQQTVNNASVGGRVVDPSGAAVQDAEVTARATDTGIANRAQTDFVFLI
jgi:hypothetical protein